MSKYITDLVSDLKLNHEYCTKQTILASATVIESLQQENAALKAELGKYKRLALEANNSVADLLEELASLKSQGIVAQQCDVCHGTGKCNDADLGDIYYNEWDCPKFKKALAK